MMAAFRCPVHTGRGRGRPRVSGRGPGLRLAEGAIRACLLRGAWLASGVPQFRQKAEVLSFMAWQLGQITCSTSGS